MSRHHKGGRQWQQAKAELRSRGDAYCWRGCGTYLLANAPQWHPQFMTMGHYIAVEDGGAQFDPNNYGPECKKCNYGDGAHRTNAKRGHPTRPMARSHSNPDW